jgi:hypothetical protein
MSFGREEWTVMLAHAMSVEGVNCLEAQITKLAIQPLLALSRSALCRVHIPKPRQQVWVIQINFHFLF